MAPRRSARIARNATTITTDMSNPSAVPTHRTVDQPEGIFRPPAPTTTMQPAAVQTVNPRIALQAMPNEFEALIGLRRMQLSLDVRASRRNELARLERDDPVGHYYAQTPAERGPYALQAAGVLFGMSDGDVSAPVAALTLMKMSREEGERVQRKARALLLAG